MQLVREKVYQMEQTHMTLKQKSVHPASLFLNLASRGDQVHRLTDGVSSL